MKKAKPYVCPSCNAVMTSTGEGEISCCGRKLPALSAKPEGGQHLLKVETAEGESYITFSHETTKEHYLNFIYHVTCDRMLFVELYLEQGGEARISRIRGGKLYFRCSRHGLWINDRIRFGARNQRDNQLQ